ncbi:MAG: RNA polymerase sigma factor [Myxococcales bacterium]
MQGTAPKPPSAENTTRLVSSYCEFLAFVEARVPSRVAAEEILQAAFVRGSEKGGAVRQSESVVAWFYRLLRNAMVDYSCQQTAEQRALDRQREEALVQPGPELRKVIRLCVNTLLPTLKPQYAEILQMIDLENLPLSEAAATLKITTNNATVRLHRARRALRRQVERSCATCATHGCLDCTCGSANLDSSQPASSLERQSV